MPKKPKNGKVENADEKRGDERRVNEGHNRSVEKYYQSASPVNPKELLSKIHL